MLLPVMILMGSRILGWDVVDIEVVMHVGRVEFTSLFFQSTRVFNFIAAHRCILVSQFFVALQDAESRKLHKNSTRDHCDGSKITFHHMVHFFDVHYAAGRLGDYSARCGICCLCIRSCSKGSCLYV